MFHKTFNNGKEMYQNINAWEQAFFHSLNLFFCLVLAAVAVVDA